MLHLSENIAGVTLLAFGNGAPNFSGSVFDPDQDSELMYSEVLGSAMFMIGVIGGWIAIVKPFKVITFDFLRDVVFLSFSVILIQIFINDDHYSWAEAIETVSLYFIYLLVVFIQFRYDKRQLEKSMEGRLSGVAPLRHITAIRPEIHAQLRKIEEQLDFTIYDEDNIPIDVEETRRMSILPIHDKKVQGANYRLITYFIEELKPFWMKEYKNISWWKLPLEILQNLIFFGMQFILPVFDYTSDRHGWNKLLNILHLFTLPMTALFVTMKTHVTIFGISLVLYSFFISILLACFVFLTSRTDQPPTYHWLYSIFNFLGSNLVIFAATSELASVLNTLGLLFNCTQSIIGVTVLSIGNSVSDLLANITLAKQGHQRMAFSACFGGSIFSEN
uniref:CSON001486 protein n=1 Tax=Culicoides sonorensis TaxID=179676 RepID=A0A336MI08_CULSO